MKPYKSLPREVIEELYFVKGLSHKAIAAHLGVSEPTLRARFRDYGFIPRERGSWLVKHKKKKFNGSDTEKAYILGFRVGDLNVYTPSRNSKIIVARTSSTDDNQVQLMLSVFGSYGGVTVSKGRVKSINCFLDQSFTFLLVAKPYDVDRWVQDEIQNSLAFMAGYIDAEANFIISQGRARFKIDSYDRAVLQWMHQWMNEHNIDSRLRLIGVKGDSNYVGGLWNNDLWRLNINKADSLGYFCKSLLPFLRHAKRIRDVNSCLDNVMQRELNGTVRFSTNT